MKDPFKNRLIDLYQSSPKGYPRSIQRKFYHGKLSLAQLLIIKQHPIPDTKLFIQDFLHFEPLDYEVYKEIVLKKFDYTWTESRDQFQDLYVDPSIIKHLNKNGVYPYQQLNRVDYYKITDIENLLVRHIQI